VLAFSNRPYRLVKHDTGEALKTMWSEGKNSFAEDPPNATVIINQQLQTIVLLNMNVVGIKQCLLFVQTGLSPLLKLQV